MKHFFLIGLTCIGLFCLIGFWTNRQLDVDHFNLALQKKKKRGNSIKIMHISDIHFGHLQVKQAKLTAAIKKERPDLILVTGDTVDRTEDVTQSGIQDMINAFADIAPTYVIEGNHERTSGQYDEWRQLMLTSQAHLIENQVVDLDLKGEHLSLIGLFNEHTTLPREEQQKLDPTRINLLLAHHPELITDYLTSFESFNLDAVFSGHAHGGQIRLPMTDGLLAPNQGFLPKFTNGRYTFNQAYPTTLFVSRGLSNSSFPFRLFNNPHLISITLN